MNSSTDLFDHLMTEFLNRMQRWESDNYDARRFSYDGVDRSKHFDLEKHKRYLCFVINRYGKLFETWQLLADDASRLLFVELILYRLMGHLHVRLKTNTPEYWATRERLRSLPREPSKLKFRGLFGPLEHFSGIDFAGEGISADVWDVNVEYSFVFHQYHYDRDGVVIRPQPGDHIADCGACFGDTALAFAACVKETGRVYTFEVQENLLAVIRHNIQQNPSLAPRIHLYPCAVGDVDTPDGSVYSDPKQAINPGFTLQGKEDSNLRTRTIDSLVDAGEIERVDFIKMDIEGYELKALKGAEQSIRRFRPRLAISIYHQAADFFEIPGYLHGLGLGYQFHLDHYTIFEEETILYATPLRD